MRIAFLVLAHEYPDVVIRLLQRVTAEGDLAVVHWDRKNPIDLEASCREALTPETMRNIVIAERHDVRWGGWSVVEATLACLRSATDTGREFDYAILLSGADYPIRSLPALKAFLAAEPEREYIECHNPDLSTWVTVGLSKERYEYWHFFNWRTHPKQFDRAWKIQRSLGLKRRPPVGLKPHLGSQWWAITWKSARKALEISGRGSVRRFFRTVWVPDEIFFQTVIASTIPPARIGKSGLTFYHFTPRGRPITLYDDHLEFVVRQQYFFARKLSPYATKLRDGLDKYVEEGRLPSISRLAKDLGEYSRHLDVYGQGLWDTRKIGLVEDSWFGDLGWNRRPYFVVVAPSSFTGVEQFRDVLNATFDLLCYGDVFSHAAIDYAVPGHELASYPMQATALRDHRATTFLSDLVHASPSRHVGFVLRVPTDHPILEVAIWDRNAFFVACFPDPPGSQAVGGPDGCSLAAEAEFRFMHRTLGRLRDASKTPFVWKYQSTNASIARAGIVDRLSRAMASHV